MLDPDPYQMNTDPKRCTSLIVTSMRIHIADPCGFNNARTSIHVQYLDVLNGRVHGTAQEGEEPQVAKSSFNPRLRLSCAVAQGVHNPETQIKISNI
jgi:hypothetical protein